MKISKQLGTSEILKMTDSQLVYALFNKASYCYYMLNESPTLDLMIFCTLLTEKME